jgi:hypothetical protein
VSKVGYRVLLVVILALHFGYIAYLVLGGFLAWRWPKAIWPHLAATGWAVLIVLNVVNCPLTAAENWARRQQGLSVTEAGFIDRYLTGVIYPARYLNEVRLAVAIVVAVAWAGAYLRWRSRRRPPDRSSTEDSGQATLLDRPGRARK